MEKLTDPNMTTMDMIMIMSEGNQGALQVLMNMMSSPKGFMDILLCDSYDIRGSKLYMLNNDCCDRNMDKFYRTLMMIRDGVFSQEQIHENLNLIRAIPFIDDTINIDGTPEYGKEFGPGDAKWEEFCNQQKVEFEKKLNIKINQKNEKKRQ